MTAEAKIANPTNATLSLIAFYRDALSDPVKWWDDALGTAIELPSWAINVSEAGTQPIGAGNVLDASQDPPLLAMTVLVQVELVLRIDAGRDINAAHRKALAMRTELHTVSRFTPSVQILDFSKDPPQLPAREERVPLINNHESAQEHDLALGRHEQKSILTQMFGITYRYQHRAVLRD